MTTKAKKNKIKKLAVDMLKASHKEQLKMVEKALNAGAIDVDAWDENSTPMVLPKTIIVAIFQREADQYDGTGTSHEKRIKKEVRNLKCFL